MTLRNHGAAALPLMAGIYLATRSVATALLAGASSVLIDVDHVPDYVYFRHGWRGLGDFFTTCYESRIRKTFALFHAWEWAIACWMLILLWSGPAWLLAVGAGITYHLVLDQLANGVTPSFYWISCRAAHRFEFALFSASNTAQMEARGQSDGRRLGEVPTRDNPFIVRDSSLPLEP